MCLGRRFVGVCGAGRLWCYDRSVAQHVLVLKVLSHLSAYLTVSLRKWLLFLMAECLMPRPSVRSCIAGCRPAWHMVSAFRSVIAKLITKRWEYYSCSPAAPLFRLSWKGGCRLYRCGPFRLSANLYVSLPPPHPSPISLGPKIPRRSHVLASYTYTTK